MALDKTWQNGAKFGKVGQKENKGKQKISQKEGKVEGKGEEGIKEERVNINLDDNKKYMLKTSSSYFYLCKFQDFSSCEH